ncbi:hypothetical protein PybrP1_009663 [[Pythium] brassicae (nom. inval.)]|nr:hypothetical protein PybrP1_009663 [[Pythium] brassicae (nom. inval.)]
MRLAVVLLLVLSLAAVSAEPKSELRRLVTLSRHGSRAPNGVVETICPGAARVNAYHVPLEQLTEVGMRQMLAAGEHLRAVYVDEKRFLAPSFNGVNNSHFETYFRADAATRCSQSATALGYGLYPDGTGPHGFPRQPVPVTMQLLPNEHDFAAPKGPCSAVLNADLSAYATSRALELIEKNRAALDAMGEVCGVALDEIPTVPGGEDLVLGVKDIADMFIFDRDEGLPRAKGLTAEVSDQLEHLAFQHLMERYYSTDREVTYWVGGFADLLLSNLNAAAHPGSPSPAEYRYFSYHGHRELLHGLGKMLGWNFRFEGLPEAMNMTALHPATTLAFELHARTDAATGAESYFVETYIWSPKTAREQVALAKCSARACPLDEFKAIVATHIAKTGTWQEICNYHPIQAPANDLAQQPAAVATTTTTTSSSSTTTTVGNDSLWARVSSGSLIVLAVAFAMCLVFAVYKAAMHMRALRRQGYMPI